MISSFQKRIPFASLAAISLMALIFLTNQIQATAQSTETQVGTPSIEVEPTELDLGNLAEGSVAEFKYTIRNTGSAPLEISDIKATCGCTDVEMKKPLIAPGKSSELTGRFDTRQRWGRQIKTINLKTNDPHHRSMSLGFKAFIYREILVEPAYLMLDTVLRQEGMQRKVRIQAWTDPPLEITKIRVLNEDQPLQVKQIDRIVDLRKDDKASTGPLTVIDLEVTIPKDAPISLVAGKIEMQTNSKANPSLWIPFQGRISGDVYAKPIRVYFGAAQPGVTLTKVVTLTSRSKTPFKIESIDGGKLGIGMKPLTDGDQTDHRVELSLTIPDNGEFRFRDEIHLKIKHPTMDSLGLQVSAIARPSRNNSVSVKIKNAREKQEEGEKE